MISQLFRCPFVSFVDFSFVLVVVIYSHDFCFVFEQIADMLGLGGFA